MRPLLTMPMTAVMGAFILARSPSQMRPAAEMKPDSRPVVMLTAFSQRDLVDRARQAGAMAYVVKPFGKADLIPAIEIAIGRFAEIKAVEAEVSDLTERLESRKAVDRAKGLLQTGLGLTEPEAFRWIQKTAMDLRLSMRQVADGVVEHGPGTDQPSDLR